MMYLKIQERICNRLLVNPNYFYCSTASIHSNFNHCQDQKIYKHQYRRQ